MKFSLIQPLILLLILCISENAIAQAATYIDPAQAYNKLLIDKNSGTYTRVGNFKVIGTPYLFGEKQRGSVFSKLGRSTNTALSFNTYTQEVEVYLNESASPLIQAFGIVDSFYLNHTTGDENINLHFINAGSLGFEEKAFLQLVAAGKRFNLYKKYKSSLDYVSTNYVEPELRQFDLAYDYYAYDLSAQTFKKLKLTTNALKKEFGAAISVSDAVTNDKLTMNPEQTLVRLFEALNK